MVRTVIFCLSCVAFLAALATGPLHTEPLSIGIQQDDRPRQTLRVPGSDYVFVVGSAESGNGVPDTALLVSLVSWISDNFDLPQNYDLPNVELVPATKIAALRYGTPSDTELGGTVVPSQGARREVLSVYHPVKKTIYLRDDWKGSSPADLSILVHELVHHLQALANLKFACPGEREELAYKAQESWLRLFGHDLLNDFEIDPFTLLVTTKCFY